MLGVAIFISAAPYKNVLAAKRYSFVYDNRYAQNESYMALTEILEDYTVLPGDSLWTIAEKQLGNGNYYPELAARNDDILTDPDLIYPEMRLQIARTGYIRKDDGSYGTLQMSRQYAIGMPRSWTIGLTQSGGAGGNFVMLGEGEIACLLQDKTKEVTADTLDWQACTRQISAYVEDNYRNRVSELHFEHYRMDGQGNASGELYLYSYLWHISPDDYPNLTCKVCVGLKLTEHIQAEFVGYTHGDYDILGCVRYVTASFEEHFDSENGQVFTVNDSNMSIVPESEWQLNGMYDSFAYIDEYYTALFNRATQAQTEEKSRYHSFGQ